MSLGSGSVTGGPRLLLRLEGLAVLALSIALYARVGGSWGLFALLFLAPDLALLGYLAGSRVGALAYNSAHTYVGPALVAASLSVTSLGTAIALIWAAHIGMDRGFGLGLKYSTGFRVTHLGALRAPDRSPSTG